MKRTFAQKMGMAIKRKRLDVANDFKRAISQTGFANRLGVSQPGLSKIEAGSAVLGVEEWLRFCKDFKVDPFSILEDES